MIKLPEKDQKLIEELIPKISTTRVTTNASWQVHVKALINVVSRYQRALNTAREQRDSYAAEISVINGGSTYCTKNEDEELETILNSQPQ